MEQYQCTDCPLCINGIYATGSLLVDFVSQRLFLVTDGTVSFADIGDVINKQVELSTHASNVLQEKSRGLLTQNLSGNQYIDIQYGKFHKYRMFIVYVNGKGQEMISTTVFNKANLPIYQKFYQLKEMVSVPIQQFKDELRKIGSISEMKLTSSRRTIKIDERIALAIIEMIRVGVI
jgi:hypothetical protein